MQDKCLIIGASGQVGKSMIKTRAVARNDVCTCFRSKNSDMVTLDLADHEQVISLIRAIEPNRIIVLGGITDVDFCESNKEASFKVNVESLRSVISGADEKCHITFVSSDYVFDKISKNTDVPNPINEYGRQKMIAEHILATQHSNWLIIRTSSVFSENSLNNFGRRVVSRLLSGDEISAGSEKCTPTYAPGLAAKIYANSKIFSTGIKHICGPDELSRFNFARMIAIALNMGDKVKNVEGARVAPRPMNGGLYSNIVLPSLYFSVKEMVARIVREEQ